MGKSLGDTGKLVNLVKHLKSSKQAKQATTTSGNQRVLGQEKLKKKKTTTTTKMESSSDIDSINNNKNNNSSSNISDTRVPLSEVVSDCVKRWFKDTLKEAKAGDINMQVLVAQMYYSGYGIPRDAQKGRVWMTRASRTRSSVWKVTDKHPGYNASDSDSDELNGHS